MVMEAELPLSRCGQPVCETRISNMDFKQSTIDGSMFEDIIALFLTALKLTNLLKVLTKQCLYQRSKS